MADYGRLPLCGGKLRSRNGKVRLVLLVPQLTVSLILPSLSPVLSTHSVTYSLIIFVLIKSFNAWQCLNFVIASAELLPLLIHLISIISLLLYNYHKHIRPTISCFFYIILSLTKQLYKDFKSV